MHNFAKKQQMSAFDDSMFRILGKRIKEKRMELKLSQEYLANKINLVRTSLSNIETGRQQIPLNKLYELSKCLNTEIHLMLPTYKEVIEEIKDGENNNIQEILDKQNLDLESHRRLSEILKNL